MSGNWLDRPVAEIVRALRSRDVRSRELVLSALSRIRETNPRVNAVVTLRGEEALDEAEAADRRLDAGRPAGPIDGLPVTVKDVLDTAGVRTTSGCRHRANRIPLSDAPAVARWRQGGAIVVAKTNAPEFGFSPETDNLVAGRTDNPHDSRLTSGGSSGGEAALLAAGGSVLGLGSDISGSLRVPAHFCGVASLKPTHGWISNEGHPPPFEPWQDELLTVGPLARRVEDLVVGWKALQSAGAGTGAMPSLQRVRVALAARDDPKLSPRCAEALDRAAEALEDAGHEVVPVEIPAVLAAEKLWERILLADGGASLRRALEDGHPFFLPFELPLSLLGLSDRSDMMLAALAILGRPRPTPLAELVRRREALRNEVSPHLGPDRAILLPVTPGPAHRHWGLFPALGLFRYLRLANVLGLPVVVPRVLAGRGPGELPAGVQLTSAPGSESLLLDLGIAVERALPSR